MRHRDPTLIVDRQHRRSRRQTHSLPHGVNLSAVLIHGEDILGDGVNIAARLEDVSGGIGVIGIGRSSASYSAPRAGNCGPHRLRKTKTSKRTGKSCYSRIRGNWGNQ
jgi:class 3 adenylate cyclase